MPNNGWSQTGIAYVYALMGRRRESQTDGYRVEGRPDGHGPSSTSRLAAKRKHSGLSREIETVRLVSV